MISENPPKKGLLLYYLKIKAFKCFNEETKVGPFDSITGIIGPNGVGKSSIVEAISFCLCKDKLLNIKRFAYDDIFNNKSKSKKVHITLVLKDEDIETVLERTLDSNNKSVYFVDGERYDLREYMKILKEKKLLGLTILSQEELHFFTQKNSKELMNLFERVSGSFEFKKEYEKKTKTLKNLEMEINNKNDIIRNLRRDRKNAKMLISSNEDAKKISEDLEVIDNEIFEYKLSKFQLRMNEKKKILDRTQKKIDRLFSEIDTISGKFILEKKKNSVKDNNELQLIFQNFKMRKEKILEKNKEIKKMIEENIDEIKNKKKDIKLILEPNLEMSKENFDKFDKRIKENKKKLNFLENNIEEKKNMRLNSTVKNFLYLTNFLEEEILEYKKNMENSEEKLEALDNEIKLSNRKINVMHLKINSEEKIINELKNDIFSAEAEEKIILKEESQIQKKKEKYEKNLIKIKNLEIKKNKHYEKSENLTNYLQNSEKENILLKKLENNIKGFIGIVSNSIKPLEKKYSLAIGMSLKKILDYYIVKDTQTALEIGSILKNEFLKKNILILENAPKKKKNSLTELRAFLGTKGYLAYDLIDFAIKNEDFEEYIIYFLQKVVICENYKEGIELKKKLKDNIKICVTVNGEVISDNGIEAYGSKIYLPKKIKNFVNMDFEEDNDDFGINEINEEIENLKKNNLCVNVSSIGYKVKQIGMKKEKLELDLKNHNNILSNYKNEISKAKKSLDNMEENYHDSRKKYVEKVDLYNDKKNEFEKKKNDFVSKNKFVEDLKELDEIILLNKAQEIEIVKTNEVIKEIIEKRNCIDLNKIKTDLKNGQNFIKSKKEILHSLEKSLEENNNKIKTGLKEEKTLEEKIKKVEEQKIENEMNKEIMKEKIRSLEKKLENLQNHKDNIYREIHINKVKALNLLEEEEISGVGINDELKEILKNRNFIEKKMNLTQETNEESFNLINCLVFVDKNNVINSIADEIDEMLNQKIDQSEKLQKKLKNMITNLDSEDFIESEKHKKKEIDEKLKKLRKKLKELIEEEILIKEEQKKSASLRTNRLNSFLNPLSLIINNFYKFVNCNEEAQANFIIENPFKPFLAGIIFSAIPPKKSFTIGTDSLSSGESSLANLSLFLAINEVLNSNFIILDEIDANLDFDNVMKFISTFGKFSRKVQVVFVSHKPFVYKHAEVLLGITKHPDKNMAVCYSLDLKKISQR